MSRNWESDFFNWSKGPSESEKLRAENAERQIRKAIDSSVKLKNRNIKVFTQGSYRNRVNVQQDSDVDIGVICYDTFFPVYPDDNVKAQLNKNFESAEYTYAVFKDELEEALVARFGKSAVSRGSKSFDIKENTYRVESDVAAFFEHRRYSSASHYKSGVEMRPDDRKPLRVINWPEQHYENGVQKNKDSAKRYKKTVRILKKLSNEMASKGIESAKDTPSFLVECLVFNAELQCFQPDSYVGIVRSVLANLYNNTLSDDKCEEWGEVSELKYLFRGSQPWTRQGANLFLGDAWDYIGFK